MVVKLRAHASSGLGVGAHLHPIWPLEHVQRREPITKEHRASVTSMLPGLIFLRFPQVPIYQSTQKDVG